MILLMVATVLFLFFYTLIDNVYYSSDDIADHNIFINQLRENGKPLIEACVEAGKTRLRPILMTALTTVFGLSTMALGISNGSELLQPLAITAIGGLLYSTILTLGIVPAVYVLVNRRALKKEQNK